MVPGRIRAGSINIEDQSRETDAQHYSSIDKHIVKAQDKTFISNSLA